MGRAQLHRWTAKLKSVAPWAFWGLWGLSALSLTALVVWLFADASSPITLDAIDWLVRFSLGRIDRTSFERELYGLAFAWSKLGWRVAYVCLLSLAAVAFFTLATVFWLRSPGRARRTFPMLALFATAVASAASVEELEWAAIKYHTSAELPRFQVAANYLSAHWPISREAVPNVGTVLPHPRNLNRLIVLSAVGSGVYSVRQTFGPWIERHGESAQLWFSLSGPPDCWAVFCPAEAPPAESERMGTQDRPFWRCEPLQPGWYLVRSPEPR
jgi:hypothetical protein